MSKKMVILLIVSILLSNIILVNATQVTDYETKEGMLNKINELTDENKRLIEENEKLKSDKIVILTEDVVRELWKKSLEALGMFEIQSLYADYNEPLRLDNKDYYKVIDDRFPDYRYFEEYLSNIFSKSYSQILLKDSRYKEKDGYLYTLGGEKGCLLDWSNMKLKFIDLSQDGKRVNYEIKVPSYGYEKNVDDYTIFNFTVIYENDEWKVDVFDGQI